MARPSKNQIAAKKKAKQVENRNRNLDAFWEEFKTSKPWDEFEVTCEGCGQAQLAQNPVCVVCGGSTAVFRNTITM